MQVTAASCTVIIHTTYESILSQSPFLFHWTISVLNTNHYSLIIWDAVKFTTRSKLLSLAHASNNAALVSAEDLHTALIM